MPASPRRAIVFALAFIPLLSACDSTATGPVRSANAATATRPAVRQPVSGPRPTARVHMMPGLEGVIGANVNQLTRQFGSPRLDVWEGDARKLQFSGSACVLDIYLYPSATGREPQATYVDARRASDGVDVDRAACVSALRKR
ncbi:MAG: hypothetical protein KDE21_14475 [Novosphingobium sp.]|nr:hypothetical protein [Novosphingobium sp.]